MRDTRPVAAAHSGGPTSEEESAGIFGSPLTTAVPRKQTKVWVTHTGRQVRICDMTNEMLAGTLRMLKRAGELWQSLKLVTLVDGEGVDHAALEDVGVGPRIPEMNLASQIVDGNVEWEKTHPEGADGVLTESWLDHVPARDFFDSMILDAERRGLFWDTGKSRKVADLIERARAVRESIAKSIEYTAGSSRAQRRATF